MGRVPLLALTGAEQPFGGLESIMHSVSVPGPGMWASAMEACGVTRCVRMTHYGYNNVQ